MKTIPCIVLLALCLSAYAAPLPPFPTVTRPAPLLSPKAASAPKSTPMLAPVSELPRVPMMVEFTPGSPGRVTLLVDAFKPANTTMQFEYAITPSGPWSFLQGWGTYPESQWVGIAWIRVNECVYVRATHGAAVMAASALALAPKIPPEGVIKLPPSKTKPKRLQ